jgi:hypothetical protein
MQKFIIIVLTLATFSVAAQDLKNNPNSNHGNKFEQLGTILPTPNEYRTASGAPGPKYWQQRADYNIKCELDEEALRLKGSETITYFNNSPDQLTYLWLQLDENEHSETKNANYQFASSMPDSPTQKTLEGLGTRKLVEDFGVNITSIQTPPASHFVIPLTKR